MIHKDSQRYEIDIFFMPLKANRWMRFFVLFSFVSFIFSIFFSPFHYAFTAALHLCDVLYIKVYLLKD